jgi:hypothetical protein
MLRLQRLAGCKNSRLLPGKLSRRQLLLRNPATLCVLSQQKEHSRLRCVTHPTSRFVEFLTDATEGSKLAILDRQHSTEE